LTRCLLQPAGPCKSVQKRGAAADMTAVTEVMAWSGHLRARHRTASRQRRTAQAGFPDRVL